MMRLLFMLLLVTISSKSKAQEKKKFAAMIIDSVPLFLESKIFIDSIYKDSTIVLVSAKLKLSLAQRVDTIYGRSYLSMVASCLPKEALLDMEYRIVQTGNSWRPLSKRSILFDTVLTQGAKVVLQFRKRSSRQMVQQTILKRADIKPRIIATLLINRNDNANNKVKSKAAYQTKLTLPGLDSLRQNILSIPPGKKLELQFANLGINQDSCIEYRVRMVGSKGNDKWNATGHLLSMPPIKANRNYLLDIRYAEMDSFYTYEIHSFPFWWQQFWAMALFVVIAVAFGIGIPRIIRNRRVRNKAIKNDKVRSELKILQNQLPPHFVRNAASSIVTLVSENQNESANLYLGALTDIMSGVLNNSNRLFIKLSDEISALKKYMSLEQLRFGFKYSFEIDDQLDTSDIEILPMLLQPSLENAVKHGVAEMGKCGLITIAFYTQENNMVVIIDDNGRGLTKNAKEGHGHGIAITRERIRLLGILEPNQRIDYLIEHNSQGAKVIFTFENLFE
ncbi:MAG: histidine kinase [Sediminibacterium sp.]